MFVLCLFEDTVPAGTPRLYSIQMASLWDFMGIYIGSGTFLYKRPWVFQLRFLALVDVVVDVATPIFLT